MPNRPSHEFKTSGGHVLNIADYITGAENWAIRQIYLKAKDGSDSGEIALQAERKAIETVILSFDADSANIADKVLGLPLVEYREVIEDITPIIEGKKKFETS